jgi:predicted CoA-binding protein
MSDVTREILAAKGTWAVVGLSPDPSRDSYRIASLLRARGFRVVPVNPHLTEWRGETAYPDLPSIPFAVDVVDLFRRSSEVPPHVDEAVAIGAKAVWMQLGVRHAEAAARARAAGLTVVEDRCPAIEFRRIEAEDQKR